MQGHNMRQNKSSHWGNCSLSKTLIFCIQISITPQPRSKFYCISIMTLKSIICLCSAAELLATIKTNTWNFCCNLNIFSHRLCRSRHSVTMYNGLVANERTNERIAAIFANTATDAWHVCGQVHEIGKSKNCNYKVNCRQQEIIKAAHEVYCAFI